MMPFPGGGAARDPRGAGRHRKNNGIKKMPQSRVIGVVLTPTIVKLNIAI
jgi:hypothetical protein